MKKELLFSLMITLILVPFLASAGLMPVIASGSPPGPRISVEPPEIIDTTMVPCSSDFTINVTIANVTGMKACEFNLTYDSSVTPLLL